MMSARSNRHVPRIAPRILLSSNELIEWPHERGENVNHGQAPPRRARGAHDGGAEIPGLPRFWQPYNQGKALRLLAVEIRPACKMSVILVLIPARMASHRLPGKPLADIAGVPMVVHVLRRAEAA